MDTVSQPSEPGQHGMASEVANDFLETLKAASAPQLAVPTLYNSSDAAVTGSVDNTEHAIAAFHQLTASLGDEQPMILDDEKSVSSESDGPGDGKKGKVKKQEKQKKIVVNFVEALTCPTEEALQPTPVKCNEQMLPPLDKQKLLELFEQHVNAKDISPSVFWKYTKREVYVDRNVYRNRKTGGYKGFSGVQWRSPDRPEDLATIETRLHKIRRYLTRGKDVLIQAMRDAYNGDDAGRGKYRKRKLSTTPAKGGLSLLELADPNVHEDVAGAHMLVQAAAISNQIPGLSLDGHTGLTASEVVAAAQAAAAAVHAAAHGTVSQQEHSNDSDSDDEEMASPPPTKKLKLTDEASVGTTPIAPLPASSASSSAKIQSISSRETQLQQQYQQQVQQQLQQLQQQQQAVLQSLSQSIGHLQLIYQSLSTHTAIEMLKLLNDAEVLAALQNLKALAPLINQQFSHPDTSSHGQQQ